MNATNSDSSKSVDDQAKALVERSIQTINEAAGKAVSHMIGERERAVAATAGVEKNAATIVRKLDFEIAKFDAFMTRQSSIKKLVDDLEASIQDAESRIKSVQGYVIEVSDMIGKTVTLKSGGMKMTAASMSDDGGILCFWVADGACMCQESIPVAALKLDGEAA